MIPKGHVERVVADLQQQADVSAAGGDLPLSTLLLAARQTIRVLATQVYGLDRPPAPAEGEAPPG